MHTDMLCILDSRRLRHINLLIDTQNGMKYLISQLTNSMQSAICWVEHLDISTAQSA